VTLNPVPVTLSDETTRFAVPVFFSVIVCELFDPSTTLPKVTLDGVADIAGCVPVPLTAIAVGDPGTFVLSEMLPLALPADVGVNTALKVMVLVGVSVCAAKPVTLNPVPVTLSDETTRFTVPVFWIVIVCELVAPSATLPNVTLDGVMDIAGCAPEPVRAIAVGDPARLVETEMLPDTAPADVGVKTALKLKLPPAASVCAVKPTTLKPAPVTLSDETTKFAVPVFLNVIACAEPVPTATLPKVILDGVTDIPACVPVPLKGIAVGEPDRFVDTEMLPVTLPAAVGAKTAVNVMLLLGVTVCVAKPVTLNPVPVTLSEETTKFAVPVFLSVINCVPVAPSATLPKLTLDGVTETPACVPVPLSGIAVGEPDRFVFTEMLPETSPAEVGAKTASNAMLAFGANVCAVKPVTLNPEPVTLSDETTRFAVPVFFNVINCVALVPSATLPKATLDGVIDIPGCAPAPLNEIVIGEPGASDTTEMLPETLAVDAGVNVALKVMLLPAASVCAEKPVTANPVPVTLSDETDRFAVPVFFTVIAFVAVVPSATLPKLTLDGVTEIPAAVALPLSAIVRVGLEASLLRTRVPVAAEAAVGAN
jgi:hypothetical protein